MYAVIFVSVAVQLTEYSSLNPTWKHEGLRNLRKWLSGSENDWMAEWMTEWID